MAYITKDEVKLKSIKLKEVAKNYGCKITVSGSNSSTLKVNVVESRVDPIDDCVFSPNAAQSYTEVEFRENLREGWKNGHGINVYWVDTHYAGETRKFINELLAVMKEGWYDMSDPMYDHFNIAWYNKITFGNYDKPCVLVK